MANQKVLLDEVFKDLHRIIPVLDRVADKLENDMYPSSDLNVEDRLVMNELQRMRDRMDGIVSTVKYLEKPVMYEGNLWMNQNGRYVVDGLELSCGSVVEILIWDEEEGRSDWAVTRIEHSSQHGGYYAYGYPGVSLQGTLARVRRR